MFSRDAEFQLQSPLIRPFFPALDGLRAIAFFLVFLLHYLSWLPRWRVFQWGWVGVDIFFVLSGFLITGILFDSIGRKRYFVDFYARRSLRIFPLYFAFWLVLLLFTPLLHVQWNRYVVSLALYIGNFFYIGSNFHLHPAPYMIAYSSLRHPGNISRLDLSPFWSLCVEEQFYLVWPFVVWFVRSRKALLALCLTAVVVMPAVRYLYAARHPEMVAAGALYFVTYFRFDTLLAGAAAALWLRGNPVSPARLRPLVSAGMFILACALFLLYRSRPDPNVLPQMDYRTGVLGFTLVALLSVAVLLLAIDPATIVSRALQAPWLTALGRISYGLYLFHNLFQYPLQNNVGRLAPYHLEAAAPLLVLVLTIITAQLSFRFLESPFLRLKNRFSHNHRVSDPRPVPAHA